MHTRSNISFYDADHIDPLRYEMQQADQQYIDVSVLMKLFCQLMFGVSVLFVMKWLQNLLLPGSKLKSNDERRSYTITKPEPLVCFALCCGGQSDPAVGVCFRDNFSDHGKTFIKQSR